MVIEEAEEILSYLVGVALIEDTKIITNTKIIKNMKKGKGAQIPLDQMVDH